MRCSTTQLDQLFNNFIFAEMYKRAVDIASQMSLTEKINLTTGTRYVLSPAELGIPSLCLQDSPLAIRFADYNSAFPTGVNVAATWDKTLAYLRSQAMGETVKDIQGAGVIATAKHYILNEQEHFRQ
ncbi:glycoside hydrolase superfamily [Aspergillus alliaceus]|uniref:glycoside hydrolase superfamily n=1 Tax=Petromyces alliaceus TaxID=209559 RepID=UPI0012A3B73D|nr:glycoside hydrolase superfamily [Aspergillus alliaceus]KAB8227706.1 glycoside hydrolase superfamily [Aspergillus alliaceus]